MPGIVDEVRLTGLTQFPAMALVPETTVAHYRLPHAACSWSAEDTTTTGGGL